MRCIIPCAGQGTRMGLNIPKTLIKVNGKSILEHVIDQWSTAVDGFVIVVSPKQECLIKERLESYPDSIDFVVQQEPKGLADAIVQVESYVTDEFVVALGDCLYRGNFEVCNFELGVGVWKTGFPSTELSKNYSVRLEGELIKQLIEKPSELLIDTYCGMGIYFLDRRVFSYMQSGFTETLQAMIDAGEELYPVWFRGEYINVTNPNDLTRAKEITNAYSSRP